VHISFTAPRLHLEEVTDLVDSLTIGQDELRYALIIYTTFRLRESAIGGYLVIVLGIASLDRLLQAVEKLG
jgi:chemotaxis protein CheC